MKDIKVLLQAGKIKEAFAAFQTLPENQQEGFFREIAPTLRPPVLIDVLYRKIKPGHTYDDFREAWLPSLKPGQNLLPPASGSRRTLRILPCDHQGTWVNAAFSKSFIVSRKCCSTREGTSSA